MHVLPHFTFVIIMTKGIILFFHLIISCVLLEFKETLPAATNHLTIAANVYMGGKEVRLHAEKVERMQVQVGGGKFFYF
jgi:hypothetical protein